MGTEIPDFNPVVCLNIFRSAVLHDFICFKIVLSASFSGFGVKCGQLNAKPESNTPQYVQLFVSYSDSNHILWF